MGALMMSASLVIVMMLLTFHSPKVANTIRVADEGPRAKGCTVWFSNTDKSRSFIEVHAVSSAKSGLDRLATAVNMVKNIRSLTRVQHVEVHLYGEGTIPYKPHLNGNTTTAFASYSINEKRWIASYATKPTSAKKTADRRAEGNPPLDYEAADNFDLENLKYSPPTEKCVLGMTTVAGTFVHPKLSTYVPEDSYFKNEVPRAAKEFLARGY